jgi:hypothetical protein
MHDRWERKDTYTVKKRVAIRTATVLEIGKIPFKCLWEWLERFFRFCGERFIVERVLNDEKRFRVRN